MIRRIFFLFGFLTVAFLTAEEIQQIEITDPIRPEALSRNDSLDIETSDPADSMLFFIDQDTLSFLAADSLEISVQAKKDTLSISELYNELQKHLDDEQQIRTDFKLPMIVEKENFHLKTPFEPNLFLKKNGFTYFPYEVSRIHFIQNYLPFFNAFYDQGFVEFQSNDYSQAVAVSEVFLGLGDIDMNHAAVNFKKGSILNIPALHLEAAYLGMDGRWLGKREKSRNFNGHLFYDHNWGKIHVYYTHFDQEISSNKLVKPPEMISSLKDIYSDMALKWENIYLEAGIRKEKSRVDTLKRELIEFMLSKKIRSGSNFLELNYEYFVNSSDEEDFHVIGINQNSRISILNWKNRLFYRDRRNYFISSQLQASISKQFHPLIYFEKIPAENSQSLWQNERLGAGFLLDSSRLKINLLSGSERIEKKDNVFLESRISTNANSGILQISLENWLLQRFFENKSLPALQSQISLEFQLDVKHGNFIKLGLSNYYLSEYSFFQDTLDSPVRASFSHFNAWLSIDITKKFEIRAKAVNLTDAGESFGLPASENLSGRHFNISLQWIFIN